MASAALQNNEILYHTNKQLKLELQAKGGEIVSLERKVGRLEQQLEQQKAQHAAQMKEAEALWRATQQMADALACGQQTDGHAEIGKALDAAGYAGRMTGHGWRTVASTWANAKGSVNGKVPSVKLAERLPLTSQMAG